MKQKNINLGEKVKVKGYSQTFIYLGKNIVRYPETGKVLSVKFGTIRKLNFFERIFNK